MSYGTVALALEALIEGLTARIREMRLGDAATSAGRPSRPDHAHAVRTRQGGRRAFASLHILVPGAWSVQRGHDTAEEVHAAIRKRLPYVTVFTHLEPVEDARSFDDLDLDASDVARHPGGP